MFSSGSYPEALGIIGEYVEITDAEGMGKTVIWSFNYEDK